MTAEKWGVAGRKLITPTAKAAAAAAGFTG